MRTISLDSLRQYRRVTVMGLGLFGGGAGVARFFADLGARVTVTDMATREKLARSVESLDGLGIRFVLGEHRPEDFTDADLIVANQAVRPDNPFLQRAREAGISIVTETGLALGLNPAPWAGVTGSSGKSTTASLLAAMLRNHHPGALFGGNIGGDLLTRTAGHPADAPVTVELSSFQLTYLGMDFAAGRIAPPRVAVLTNLAPNHLDWHPDMDDYVAAKTNLLRCQSEKDWAVLNVEDERLRLLAEEIPARVVHCGLADSGKADACFADGGAVVLRLGGEERRWGLERFRLPGRHNRCNAVEAVAAAFAMTGDAGAVAEGLAGFSGLPHRLEAVGEVCGRRFINDSKSTTPEAAIIALEALEEPKVLIAGGYDKKAPFEALAREIQRRCAGLVLVGAAGGRLGEAVREAASERPDGTLPVVDAEEDFAAAVKMAFDMTPEGGVVLLSPACASYGMFANYEERGAVFRDLAQTMGK